MISREFLPAKDHPMYGAGLCAPGMVEVSIDPAGNDVFHLVVCAGSSDDTASRFVTSEQLREIAAFLRRVAEQETVRVNNLKTAIKLLCPMCAGGLAVAFGWVDSIGDESWMHPVDGVHVFRETECEAAVLHEHINTQRGGVPRLSQCSASTAPST